MKSNVKWNQAIVVTTMLLMLAAVNWAIWAKERHLGEGEVVYLELAPVDPRSLIQGDYLALNFALANQIHSALFQESDPQNGPQQASNGYVVVRLDQQHIAHFQRFDDSRDLADNERRLRYRLRHGQVRFATDAFFFQEGHAERYEPARYGQLRLNAKGELLLAAMYDDELNKLGEVIR